MRKVLLFMALLVSLVLPMTARAQNEVVLQNVSVQLWPEYDKPSVLAIIDFSLPADAAFPVQVSLRIPANAMLYAVAKDENGLITVPKEVAEAVGDWRAITLSVDGPETYRLEYYYDFAKAGNTRSFSYEWAGDYAVQSFRVQLQEPTSIKNLSTNPAMSDPFPNTNGLILHELSTTNLAVGATYKVDIQYDRSTDEMTASKLAVEASDGGATSAQSSLALTTVLPYILGGLGFLLIVGGGVWYWQSGRGTSADAGTRKRHASRAKDEDDSDDDTVTTYCHQCGRRASSGDKFCRSCGTRIRREE